MSHTKESVLEQLGGDAQLVGGSIIVYRNRKHIEVGKLSPSGAFNLTAEGLLLLDGDGTKPVKAAKTQGKGKAPKGKADEVELELPDLEGDTKPESDE